MTQETTESESESTPTTPSAEQVGSTALFGTWLPIETAPKERKAIMVFRSDTLCTYGAAWDDITNEWRHFGGSSYPIGGEISHWMPLPSEPNH